MVRSRRVQQESKFKAGRTRYHRSPILALTFLGYRCNGGFDEATVGWTDEEDGDNDEEDEEEDEDEEEEEEEEEEGEEEGEEG